MSENEDEAKRDEASHPESTRESWEKLIDLIEAGEQEPLTEYLGSLGSGELARALSRLDAKNRALLFSGLDPKFAASVVNELPEEQAGDYIEELSDKKAAQIVEELESDEQADILGQLEVGDAEEILRKMDPEDAQEARQLLAYDPETAGGIMVTEFLRFPATWAISDILHDLEKNAETYTAYEILYGYVVDEEEKLLGVLRFRDLLMSPKSTHLVDIMLREAVFVRTQTLLEDLEELFDRRSFYAVPVVNQEDRLVGIVRRADVEEALGARSDKAFLSALGILGGDEFRTMPLKYRSFRRLIILVVNIPLNLLAVSIISANEGIVLEMIALATFLPVVSDLSGCAGSQAMAVSIRELSLGVIRPRDLVRVLMQELWLGVLNGVLLGLTLGVVAGLWRGWVIGVIVGTAMGLVNLVAVLVGGITPMLFKRVNIDPAVASAPILTTITDAISFFIVLTLAALALNFGLA